MEKESKEKIAVALLSNQGVIYVGLGILGLGAVAALIYFGRKWFSDLVDKILKIFQGFVPEPDTQDPNSRSFIDDVAGLAYANKGDRAFSDFLDLETWAFGDASLGTVVDNYGGYNDSALSDPTLVKKMEWLKSMGYTDANGDWTAKGEAYLAGLRLNAAN